MSKDRLLSDEELRETVHELFDTSFETDLVDLINTQKRLYAESVIGEDEELEKRFHDVQANDLYGISHRNEAKTHRNQLRAEQRARIK